MSRCLRPGHDAASARAAIHDHLAARLSADDVSFLDSTLFLFAVPYSEAELLPVLDTVARSVGRTNLTSSWGIGCAVSDAVRVQLGIASPETPD